MAYKPRLTMPESGNPYYNTPPRGYNDAITGYPTKEGRNVLANCVGYAYGRFNEIVGVRACVYLAPVDAKRFMEFKGDLETGDVPKLGACMVWTETGNGYGHVAIVEEITDPTHIVTSESAYGGKAFYTSERARGGDGNWGAGGNYQFLGFIYNPAVSDDDQPDFSDFGSINANLVSQEPLEESVPKVTSSIKHPWMRRLEVTLETEDGKNSYKFGTEKFVDGDSLAISVEGHKYMSALKDECVIRIKNLPASTILQLIDGKYYNVTVNAGYENTGVTPIFKGQVLYITNAITEAGTRTNEAVILCASTMVAKYGQARLNLSLTGSVNMYAAINEISKQAGIKKFSVSNELAKIKLNSRDVENVNDTPGGWLNRIVTQNGSFVINTDETDDGNIFSIYDARNGAAPRIVKIDDNALNLSNGYPQKTSAGITLSILPVYPFRCGDVVKISNYLIQYEQITSRDQLNSNQAYFIDKNGEYIVYEIDYRLSNRGRDFSVQLLCKSRSLFQNITGTAK